MFRTRAGPGDSGGRNTWEQDGMLAAVGYCERQAAKDWDKLNSSGGSARPGGKECSDGGVWQVFRRIPLCQEMGTRRTWAQDQP